MLDAHLLSALVFTPVAGAAAVAILPQKLRAASRMVALATSFGTLFAGVLLCLAFNPENPEMQLAEVWRWIPDLGISMAFGVDGISLPFVLLTCIVLPALVVASWSRNPARPKSYYGSLLLAASCLLGVFLANDAAFFLVCSELCVLPAFMLVGFSNGRRSAYAAQKLAVFSSVASGLMLVSILWCAGANRMATGEWTFAFDRWFETVPLMSGVDWLSPHVVVSSGLAAAFCIKAGLFPLHTWLTDAVSEASPGTVALATALMTKVGVYGLLRFNIGLFGETWHTIAPAIALVGALSLTVGMLSLLALQSLRSAPAHVSLAHLGLMTLALAAADPVGIRGALLHSFNHGVCIVALAIVVGRIEDPLQPEPSPESDGRRSGKSLAKILLIVVALACLGAPGFGTFSSGLLMFVGIWKGHTIAAGLIVVVALTAAALLVSRRLDISLPHDRSLDIVNRIQFTLPELGVVVSMIVGLCWLGFRPSTLLKPIEAAVRLLSG